ncbi:MAG: dihydroorotate dehydrogenase electron transfer subunit [candidate division Zixibacteria bacterium]|nr:dihydroorotate dehydrogenase electron transfer subunit [candidate division Zixibacteria bacterium]
MKQPAPAGKLRARTATLVSTRQVGPNILQQRFAEPVIARRTQAGQFVHLLPGPDLLFRRAFSVYATDPKQGTFDILYQVLGKGTGALARQPAGTAIDALGPLGNRFTPLPADCTPILVAGGLGMAPLRLFAEELLSGTSRRQESPRPIMLLGNRRKSQAVVPFGLSSKTLDVRWATDDGSRGFRGTVVDLLSAMIVAGDVTPGKAHVYGCGPEPMLAALAVLCANQRIPCELSLERSMPCGFGVCMGCVVRGRDTSGYETYHRVCRDGPVFNAASIAF